MAKQLNVNLSFNADVKQAQAQIQALQRSLEQVAKLPGKASSLFDDVNIRKASAAALELEQHLSKAVNVDTGKLDLSRFSSSLKASNKSLSDYTTTLLSVGETGQQAFLQLATSIASAETPVTRVNARLQEFATTLKNTARWQISSSILHGFMGAVQSAYGYAQDLNESLNNIRIVTGQSVEEMDRFAERANRAAKLLSTTTVEYTDAALIYYQQGLTDEQVAERTAVTVKMANAAGQSAEVVSDQLTAVWNNFYDGSKALEYYADVMTALGAATASSTDEIAGGLEKFAAIADTIGLSYEYAASALATITSNTRQSEEVVGTALKTIFARIQGLNLGETLEDGTTLNKYSKALDAVGINIFDANKNIKSMDTLLDEIAVKWQQISKDQQIALAQTVAGTRQYTQLVALMDNWNNGDNDSMVANLSTARGSEGALTEQADIYAESWEAASDRVTAAAENIYDSLLDDDFFITILNGFEDILTAAGGFIDGLGGMEGALSLIGSIFMQKYAKEMPTVLNNLKQNLMVFTGQSEKEMQKVQEALDLELKNIKADSRLTDSYKVEAEGIAKVNAMRKQLVIESNKLSKAEIEEEERRIKNVEAMYKEASALQNLAEQKKKEISSQTSSMRDQAVNYGKNLYNNLIKSYETESRLQGKLQESQDAGDSSAVEYYQNQLRKTQILSQEYQDEIVKFNKLFNLSGDKLDVISGDNRDPKVIKELFSEVEVQIKKVINEYSELSQKKSTIEQITSKVSEQADAWKEVSQKVVESGKDQTTELNKMKQKMSIYLDNLEKMGTSAGFDKSFTEEINKLRQVIGSDIGINELTQEFSAFAEKVKGQGLESINSFEGKLEGLDNKINKMGFSPQQITAFKTALQDAGVSAAQAELILGNLGIGFDGIQKKVYSTSEVVTQFASSMMSISSLLTSWKSSFEVFSNEDADGIEKFGAAVSMLTTGMYAYNSVITLSTKVKDSAIAKNLSLKASEMAVGNATAFSTKMVDLSAKALKAHPVWSMVAIITAVIAALKGLSWLLDNISLNTASEKLEEAKEATAAMADAAEKAKNRYTDLLNTIDSYDSAIDKIDSLKIGTNEFTTALLEANEQAQALIEKYNLLPEDYYIDENGIIRFDQKTLDSVITNENENYEDNKAMLNAAKIKQNNAQLELDIMQQRNNFVASGRMADLTMDDFNAIIKEIEKSEFKNAANFFNNANDEQKKLVIAKALRPEDFDEDGQYKYGQDAWLQQSYIENLVKGLQYQDIIDFQQIVNSTDISNKNLLTDSLLSSLANEQSYQESDYKQFINDNLLDKEKYSQDIDNREKQLVSKSPDEILVDFHEMLKTIGYTIEDGKVFNEDGSENEKLSKYTDEQMRNALATREITNEYEKELNEQISKLNRWSSELSENDKKYADAFLNGNFQTFSNEEIKEIQEMSVGDLKEAYPFLNTLETFGIDVDDLLGKVVTSLDQWDPGKVDLTPSIESLTEVKNTIKDLEFGDIIDQDTFDKLGDDAKQFFSYMGDGNYQLVADAKKFYDIIMGNSSRELLNSIIESRNQLDYLEQRKEEFENKTKAGQLVQGVKEGILTEDEARSVNRGDADYEVEQKWNNYVNSFTSNLEDSYKFNEAGIVSFLAVANDINSLREQVNLLESELGKGSISNESYAAALMNIGSQYENCESKIIKYQEAIISGTPNEIEQAKVALETAIALEEVAEKYDLSAESLKAYKEQMEVRDESNLRDTFENDTGENYATDWLDSLEKTDAEKYNQTLDKLAIIQARLSKGLDSLGENWDNWNEVLSDSEATIDDVVEVMEGLQEVLADILDWDAEDVELLPADFGKKYRQEIDDVYNGVDGAIEKLQGLATSEYIATLGIDDNLTMEAQSAYEDLNAFLTNMPDLEVGMTLNDIGMTEALNKLLSDGSLTVDQMNDILSKIGYEPEIDYKEIPVEDASAQQLKIAGGVYVGDQFYPVENQTEARTYGKAMVRIPYIKGKETTYTGGGGVSTTAAANRGSGGGGGGSKPKKAEAPKKSDTVDRYKEIDDKLSENTRSMNKAEKAAEGLWGPERFDKMREGIELLEEENKLLEERLGWSKQYLEEDRAALDKAAAEAGITFTFNADGRISNYTSEMTKLYNELEAATNAANADGNATEEEQEHLDKLQEKIDAVSEAIETYDSTLDEYISDEEQMMENQLEIWEKNLDLLDQELELEIGINESDLEKLEYLLSKVEDNAYDMYEAAALMVGKVGEDGNFDTSGSQLGVYLKELQDYEDHYNKLVESYQNEDISKPQFIEELQNLQSELYDNLGSIQELDETMVHYYGDTLDAAADELGQYTDLMEHHNDVLDHYNNLMELLGNSKDYDRLDEILRSQVAVAENMTEVSKANYEMLAAEAAAREQAWQSAQMNVTMSEYEKEMLKQQWLDAQNAANEAQEQMLSDAEAWAEALKAVLENELSSLSDILNNALSGEFNSLDEMNKAIERKNSLQEEYLTKTNQIYETDKLMRTAQQAIDKSTNDVAKRRLKQFIDETDALQDQTKLSEYELEIQQAKYDLLLAEIALEEAQNAKSTVRLQRDSEGNFGYVYTADQNAVAEAEQELADAQNRLYNIGLEGANDYTQKYLDTLTEMNDELTALTEAWINNEISSWEEYERRKNELTEYYGEKMEQYNDLHGIALTTDTAVVVDAWTSGFADMTDRTEEWMTAVDDYVGKVRDAFSEYESELDKIEEETVGPDLESLEDKTEAITKANEKLVESITQENGILDALAQEITSVQNLAEEYAKLRKEIQGTIDDSEGLAKTANDLQHTESDDDPTNDMNYKAPAPEPVETPKSPTQETPSEQPQSKTVAAGAQVNAGSAKIYGQPGVGGGSQYYSNDPVYDVLEVDGEWVRVRHHSLSSGTSGWFKKSDLTAFDSGGYTGDWGGPYGKLAMLHKKELILNEHDTDNFLLTMEVMERILQMLDLQTMSSQFGGLLSSPGLRDTGSQSLEQHIEIEAHFPDATDRIEIEEAFKSMVNLASQYANRK